MCTIVKEKRWNKLKKICAGIVTFNPDVELLKSNINSIKDQVCEIIIVDNGSKNINQFAETNIKMIRNAENIGIAAALNQICKLAILLGYDWVLTLDQDSISPINLISKLSEYIENNIAIVSPKIVYKNNEVFANDKTGIQEVNWVITSASLTNLKIWEQLGGFDEKLFIDGVDRDYCIRATRQGFKILKCNDISILHELGNLKCIYRLGKIIYVTNHSSFRKYYMARNAIYIDKKLSMCGARIYILKMLLKVVLYENKKVKKIFAILKGIIDAKKMDHS